jgi:hypothetical protein
MNPSITLKFEFVSYLTITVESKSLRFEISAIVVLVLYQSPFKFSYFNCAEPKNENLDPIISLMILQLLDYVSNSRK